MNEPTLITGASEAEMAQNLTAYLQQQQGAFQHLVALQQAAVRRVLLEVDIDPGGGFESGYATTRLSAPVSTNDDFAFTIHPEGFLADVAKLFGAQDVVIGYPEFDKKVIIKTNDAERLKAVLQDAAVRQTLATLDNYTLQLPQADSDGERLLQLEVEEGITEPDALLQLYRTFTQVLARAGFG